MAVVGPASTSCGIDQDRDAGGTSPAAKCFQEDRRTNAFTTPQDRKAIVRCLLERVVVHVEQRSEYVDVTIMWHGGVTSQHQVVRPVGSYTQLRDDDLLITRIKALHGEGKVRKPWNRNASSLLGETTDYCQEFLLRNRKGRFVT